MKKSIVLIAFLLVTMAMAQEPAVLAYKFNPGTTYTYGLADSTNMVQEMGGREMITDATVTGKLVIVPQSVSEKGEATCWVSFSELSTKVKNAMMDTTIVMNELLGKRSEIVYAANGKPLQITALDSLPKMGQMIRMGMSPDAMLRRMLARMPEQAIAVGGTWKETEMDSIKQGGLDIVITPDVTYTVKSVEEVSGHSCFKIEFAGTNAITGKGSQMGAEIFLEGEGKIQGWLYFAPKEGLLFSIDAATDQEQTIAISGAANMTIAQTVAKKTKLSYIP